MQTGGTAAQRLLAWRKRARLTQTQFAVRVGSDASRISKLENGAAIPTLTLAVAIDRETAGEIPSSAWLDPPGDVAAAEPPQTNEAA